MCNSCIDFHCSFSPTLNVPLTSFDVACDPRRPLAHAVEFFHFSPADGCMLINLIVWLFYVGLSWLISFFFTSLALLTSSYGPINPYSRMAHVDSHLLSLLVWSSSISVYSPLFGFPFRTFLVVPFPFESPLDASFCF